MPKSKLTLGDKLRADARKREQEAAARRREKERLAWEEKDRKATELWNEMLNGLEKRIKKEAKEGNISLEIPELVEGKAESWARQNGMHVHFAHSDDDSEIPMYYPARICWAEHPRAW